MKASLGYLSLMFAGVLVLSSGCTAETNGQTKKLADAELVGVGQTADIQDTESSKSTDGTRGKKKMQTATFGAGCFWCVEAVFLELDGVESVVSGYMGGKVENPTYKQVCTGRTGHAEVVQIEFDENKISFDVLLQVFWQTHDPTTRNRQGPDVGTQYRSVVFYHNDEQRELTEKYKQRLNKEKVFRRNVVTEISPAEKFYVAEDYHQDFFNNNPNQPYCRALIPPKLEKLKKVFGDKLKKK